MKCLFFILIFFEIVNCNSQTKHLSELSKELSNRTIIENSNTIIISRTVYSSRVREENDSIFWKDNYKLFFIQQKEKSITVEEYHDGKLANIFQIKQSNLFSFLKPNFKKLMNEKLKDFEYNKDGSNIYIASSDNSTCELLVYYNNKSHQSIFKDFKLDFLSNSKLVLTRLIEEITKELTPYFKLHPFYVERS